MGLFNNLLDAEARAVKKAVRSLDVADKHMQAKETDKALVEADKARVALEGLDPNTVANLNDYRTAISRTSNICSESEPSFRLIFASHPSDLRRTNNLIVSQGIYNLSFQYPA